MKKFYLYNKGTCTRLKLFGEEVKNLLQVNGWKESEEKVAKIIFVNSCSFLKKKEREFLGLISRIDKRKKIDQKIAVFGCLPKTAKEEILKIDSEILTFGRDIDEIAKFFKFKNKKYKIAHSYKKDDQTFWQRITLLVNDRFLRDNSIYFRLNKEKIYHLRISEGCLGNCTYCTEKFTTKFRSEKICDVIWKYLEGYKLGYRLFSINSDDTAAFGSDRKESIYSLMSVLLDFKHESVFAIAEFNPRGVLNEKIYRMLANRRIFYITIPIQSGSQKVLNKMRRPYKIDRVITNIKRIKRLNPKLKINTHIIVGFPGESERDFAKSLKLIKSGIFNRVKIFSYSDNPKAESYNFPGKISKFQKLLRSIRLKYAILSSSIRRRSLSDFLLNIKTI